MHRGIIKLHALTDTDWTGAKHDDLLSVFDYRFIFFLIGGIKIRNITFKF